MPDQTDRNLAASAAALIVTVDELRKVLVQVGDRLDVLSKRADRQRFWTAATGIGLAADMALTVFMFVSFNHQATTNAQLAALIQEQAMTSARLSTVVDKSLCPLYRIFVDSYNPNSPAAKTQGLAQYTATFDDIRNQYKALDCRPQPPR